MNSPDSKKQELHRREQELQERERIIRLRELENEIYEKDKEPPLYETRKHTPPENALKKWTKKLIKVSQFLLFVVVGIAVMRVGLFIGIWLAYGLMAAGVAFIGYKIFMDEDKTKK